VPRFAILPIVRGFSSMRIVLFTFVLGFVFQESASAQGALTNGANHSAAISAAGEIRLRGPNGALVIWNWGEVEAQITAAAGLAGTYTVVVTDGSGNATGNYQLTSSHGGVAPSPPPSSPQIGEKNLGGCGPPGKVQCGNPIDVGSGNKFEVVTDYETAGPNRLGFTRYYNSSTSTGNPTFASFRICDFRGRNSKSRRAGIRTDSVIMCRVGGRYLESDPIWVGGWVEHVCLCRRQSGQEYGP
jgi:hypothetical protein